MIELAKISLVFLFVLVALAVLETVYLTSGLGLMFLFFLLLLQLPYGWLMIEVIHRLDHPR